MSKNIRLTFTNTNRDTEMVKYLDEKTNPRAFIKDLIYREMLRDRNYINCNISQNMQSSNFVTENNQQSTVESQELQNFDFDIDDLDI